MNNNDSARLPDATETDYIRITTLERLAIIREIVRGVRADEAIPGIEADDLLMVKRKLDEWWQSLSNLVAGEDDESTPEG